MTMNEDCFPDCSESMTKSWPLRYKDTFSVQGSTQGPVYGCVCAPSCQLQQGFDGGSLAADVDTPDGATEK